jgi:platelet-activating factor acetylhydrolase
MYIGSQSEGIRMVQFFMFTPFVFSVLANVPHINTFGFIIYTLFRVFYGGMDLPKPSGPNSVGYTENFITDKGNFCAVFYPTEKPASNPVTAGFLEGIDRISSLQNGAAAVEPSDPAPPGIILEAMFDVKMNVAVDARVKGDSIPVVVFSHGLMLSARSYAALCCEMASYGVMVVALDHMDGSSGFTVNQHTLESVPYDCKMGHKEGREKQLKIRVEEVESVISSLAKPDFVRKVFGPEATMSIDLSKVAISGHSFGGITALQVGLKNMKVKGVVSLDPTFSPVQKLNESGGFKIKKDHPPFLLINT